VSRPHPPKPHPRVSPTRSRASNQSSNPNLLLAALPAADYARIVRSLKPVTTRVKQVLHQPGEPVAHVYFPGDGFCSELTMLGDGRMVEVATVGREGMAGMVGITDAAETPSATMVQGEMQTCFRMSAKAFRAEMERREAFYTLVSQYFQTLVRFIMQSTACNAVHRQEQRLARWILTAQDHMGRPDFALTQEFVAMMLGTSRPTVTVAALILQKAGLIKYSRGRVTVMDREQLEAASCECYRVTAGLLHTLQELRPRTH
jgi:CRP-like cAMP-binding protein